MVAGILDEDEIRKVINEDNLTQTELELQYKRKNATHLELQRL